jgi:predicted transcriptional regulator
MNKVIRIIEISTELDAAVERLAKDRSRTAKELLSQAVEEFLANNDDLTIELERWAEFERTGISLSEEEFLDSIAEMKQRATRQP